MWSTLDEIYEQVTYVVILNELKLMQKIIMIYDFEKMEIYVVCGLQAGNSYPKEATCTP